MIYGVVLGLHVVVCVLLILVVLLQASKGGGLAGGAFGGGGADSTMLGARGAATVLSKATTIFGGLFMVTSLTLTLLSVQRTGQPESVVGREAQQAPFGVPTAPPATAPPAAVPGTVPPAGDAAPPAGGETVPSPQGTGTDDVPGDGGQ